jgi:hypothetical protein
MAQKPKTVITDVRFQNEAEAIRKNGGIIVRVVRGEQPEWHHLAKIAGNPKSSTSEVEAAIAEMSKLGIHESEWKGVSIHEDVLIRNDSSLEALYSKVEEIAQLLEKNADLTSDETSSQALPLVSPLF